MAAHIGTAIHGMLNRTDVGFDICKWVATSASAPFWDTALGFNIPWECDYFCIMGAADRNETDKVKELLKQLFDIVNPVMSRFANLENFYAFKQDFIKHGKPHWRKRADKFYSGAWEWDKSNLLTGGAPYTDEGKMRYQRIAIGA